MLEEAPTCVALMTDFGLDDVYVGVIKGVIACRCRAPIIDLTHSIAPHDITQAAYLLSTAYHFLPNSSVVVCVVDPGVGSDRAAIAVRWLGGYFVGPDNGWLTDVIRDAVQRDDGPGEVNVPEGWEVVNLDNPAFHLENVSRTFHGRDIFAPAAAALASGVPLAELGSSRATLATIETVHPHSLDGVVTGHVVHVDHFGNLVTDIPASHLSDRFQVSIGGGVIEGPTNSYQSDESIIAIVGSSGRLEIAAPRGSAARLIAVGRGDPVIVTSRARLPADHEQ